MEDRDLGKDIPKFFGSILLFVFVMWIAGIAWGMYVHG